MLLAVAPSPALDRTLLLNNLVLGGLHRPTNVLDLPGGKGLNVARAAHRLGADVTALAVLGGHSGAVVEKLLAAEGIRADIVTGVAPTRICTTVISQITATSTNFYEPASHVTAEDWSALVERVAASLARGLAWVTVSGSLPPGIGPREIAHLVDMAHKAGARIAVDTHGDALRAVLELEPDVVKVNVHEAAEVVAPGSQDAALCARRLHELRGHGWLTVVTAGELGAVAITDRDAWVALPLAAGRYPIGSGDTFLAGLVIGLERDLSVPRALAYASSAAAANTQVPGAAIFDSGLAERWMADVTITGLIRGGD